MSTISSVPDVTSWGIQARGAKLVECHDLSRLPIRGGELTIDVENDPDGSCAGVGFTQDGRTIDFLHPYVVRHMPKDYFASCQLIGHNVKYDVQMLRSWGFTINPDQIVWDTQVAEYTLDSTKIRYGLKHLSEQIFGAKYPTFKELTGTGKTAIPISGIDPMVLANYNGCDVLFTYKLHQHQMGRITVEELCYFNALELPTLRVLLEMEERGVLIDTSYVRGLDVRFTDGVRGVVERIRGVDAPTLNLNSHQQVKQFLMDKAGLRLPSTAAEELQKHTDIPLVKDILRYRELNKLRSTYTSVLVEKSGGAASYRLHARFNQTNTQTGRLSSSEPNLQNIPTRTEEGNEIRQGFIACDGQLLVDLDYSQIEPRLMAHFSQDPALMDIFRSGKDLYDTVAEYVGCDRKVAKTLWLALAYNAGAYKIGMTAKIPTYKAEKFLQKMKARFSQFFYWRSQIIAHAEIDGGVSTMFGRFIPLPPDLAHLAPNYKVQGTAAEVVKLAMIETRPYNPVLTVHDELVFELPAHIAESIVTLLKDTMEHVVELTVPLIVEVGTAKNWAEAKK